MAKNIYNIDKLKNNKKIIYKFDKLPLLFIEKKQGVNFLTTLIGFDKKNKIYLATPISKSQYFMLSQNKMSVSDFYDQARLVFKVKEPKGRGVLASTEDFEKVPKINLGANYYDIEN